jgi:hypothetical protein
MSGFHHMIQLNFHPFHPSLSKSTPSVSSPTNIRARDVITRQHRTNHHDLNVQILILLLHLLLPLVPDFYIFRSLINHQAGPSFVGLKHRNTGILKTCLVSPRRSCAARSASASTFPPKSVFLLADAISHLTTKTALRCASMQDPSSQINIPLDTIPNLI